jgi:hypothetical protein
MRQVDISPTTDSTPVSIQHPNIPTNTSTPHRTPTTVPPTPITFQDLDTPGIPVRTRTTPTETKSEVLRQ